MEWMFVDFPLKSRSRLVWIGGEWGEEARWLAITEPISHFLCVRTRCEREGNGNYRLFLWRSYATDTHPCSHYPADQPSSLCLRSESIRFQIWPKTLQRARERCHISTSLPYFTWASSPSCSWCLPFFSETLNNEFWSQKEMWQPSPAWLKCLISWLQRARIGLSPLTFDLRFHMTVPLPHPTDCS